MNPDGTPLGDSLGEDAATSLSDDLDAEYFGWKESEEASEPAPEEKGKKKGGFGGLFGKK